VVRNVISLGNVVGAGRIRKSVRDVGVYWTHYLTNEVVHALIKEQVNALVGISMVVEDYDESARRYVRVPETHNLVQLLRFPHPDMSAATVLERFWTDHAVSGNGVLLVRRGRGTREPVELWPLDSRHIYLEREDGTERTRYYWYDPTQVWGTGTRLLTEPRLSESAVRYRPQDIVHLPGPPDPNYPRWGLPWLAPALDMIDLDNEITRFSQGFFERGAVTDHLYTSEHELTDEEIQRLETRWNRRRAGTENSFGLWVLDRTKGNLQRMGLATGSREIGLFDLRKQVEARIASAANIPPIVVGFTIGLEHATYSNYGQARGAMHEENTGPHIRKLEAELTFKLARPMSPGLRVRADLSRVMALLEWEASRQQLELSKLQQGAQTRNEARASLDLPPTQGGDVFLTPLNVTPEQAAINFGVEIPESRVRRLRKYIQAQEGTAWEEVADFVRATQAEVATMLGTDREPDVVVPVMNGLKDQAALQLEGESRTQAARRLLNLAGAATVSAVCRSLGLTPSGTLDLPLGD
jgi:HK97 family phage portal protein